MKIYIRYTLNFKRFLNHISYKKENLIHQNTIQIMTKDISL